MSEPPPAKRRKKHKRDKDKDRYDDVKFGGGTPTYSTGGASAGNARIKLILKVGGSSTPEHSDSPGPSHILSVPFDEDSRNSSLYSHSKKSKKKEKKKKKDKKHKHHHKEKKRRDKDDFNLGFSIASASTEDIPSTYGNQLVSPITLVGRGLALVENPDIADVTPAIASKEPRACVVKQRTDKQPLQKLLEHLVRALEKKDAQQFFAWPVTDKIAPGYSSIITDPMDFSSMKAKVDAGEYSTYPEFVEDFKRMCNNAMTYNHVETVYYKAAKKLLLQGLKVLSPDKIRSLVPLIPSIRMLTEEQLHLPIFPEPPPHGDTMTDMMSMSEEEFQEPYCADPTKSIHYMPPHPNDPPDPCGAFTEDLVTEEVLMQARLAAREAAHRLATRKPNSKLGFLRQKDDGSTSLAILTGATGMNPGSKEQPVCLGALTGKLTHGTTHLVGKEEKKLHRGPKNLSYGPFSSYAPSNDSSFAGLTKDESELVEATYGDDDASQYAESIYEFAKGCDYAMHMVDEILNTLTKGEHSRTINVIEERKKIQEEETRVRKEQEAYAACIQEEWGIIEKGFPTPEIGSETNTTLADGDLAAPATSTSTEPEVNIDFEAVKSLREIGIDTGFVDEVKEVISSANRPVKTQLEETTELIENLKKVQNQRLSLPLMPAEPYVHPPSDDEVRLADRIQENLIDMAKQTTPGELVSTAAIHGALGIDIKAFNYRPPPPSSVVQPQPTNTSSSTSAGAEEYGNGSAFDPMLQDSTTTSTDIVSADENGLMMSMEVDNSSTQFETPQINPDVETPSVSTL